MTNTTDAKAVPKPKVKGQMTDFLGRLKTAAAAKPEDASGERPKLVLLADIMPDPDQPRKTFDEEALRNLALSLKEFGFMQIPLLEATGGSPAYKIVDGERRWRACQLPESGGISHMPAFIRNDLAKPKGLRGFTQLVTNAQHEQIPDYEMAVAIQKVLEEEGNEWGLKSKIAQLLNRPVSRVARYLAMLEPEIEPLVRQGLLKTAEITARYRSLSEVEQKTVLDRAESEGSEITREMIAEAKVPAIPIGAEPGTLPIVGDEPAAEQSPLEPAGKSGGDGRGDNEDDRPGQDDQQNSTADFSRQGSAASAAGSPSSRIPSTKLKISGEQVETLLRFFVDKSTDKVELRLPSDLAIAIIENMQGEVPDSPESYDKCILDLLANQP